MDTQIRTVGERRFVKIQNQVQYIYRVIHKSVKHLKNSQQMDYATDHGNSYVDGERKTVEVFFKEKPAHLVALICR